MKVFVGVSGGVDSSVSAALLKDQGHEVIGVFIRTWQPDWIECTWRDERRDAMRVCAHLGIPFVELDLEQEYKTGVADYMIREYQAGRTPNPDVMCNREVKFGGFLNWARKNNGVVATGHYAQNIDGQLVKGADQTKDQSYFLWTLTKEQLKDILFPIGHLQKSEVRKLAEKYNLPTATKKDSQGICFIGDIDMKEFLSHYIETKQGDVLNEKGKVIGVHDGALFYTLGERHGFTITEKTPDDKPYYVIAKDCANNTITVSQNPKDQEISKEVILTDCVWREDITERKYTAQIRYHGELKPCLVKNDKVLFDKPDFSLSIGQSVVIYDGDVCIGGGILGL
jgi:tRNA-specific 2-thiouridylase